jgi:hypothetical protein
MWPDPATAAGFRQHDRFRTALCAYEEINLPVLLMTGQEPLEPTRRIATRISDLMPVIGHDLPSLNHMGPLLHPEVVDRVPLPFLVAREDSHVRR